MGAIADKINTLAFECDCGGVTWIRFFDAKGDHGIIEVVHRRTDSSYRERVNYNYDSTPVAVAATTMALVIGAITDKPCGMPDARQWETW